MDGVQVAVDAGILLERSEAPRDSAKSVRDAAGVQAGRCCGGMKCDGGALVALAPLREDVAELDQIERAGVNTKALSTYMGHASTRSRSTATGT